MKRTKFRLIALFLTITLLFTGCALDFRGYFTQLANVFRPVTFDNMTYTRPDPSMLEDALSDCLTGAEGKNFNKLVGYINTFNSICSRFYTNYYLAYIHYSIDTSDAYWTEEYTYCSRLTPTIQASVDDLMYALADSSFREDLESDEFFGPGYFDSYDGESPWTDEYLDLKNQEAELINQYYTLSSLAGTMDPQSEPFYSTVGAQLEMVYVNLVYVRQQIATEAGYGSYGDYAYAVTYQRDYTPTQAATLMGDIRKELAPLYLSLAGADVWAGVDYCTEDQTFAYVQRMAQKMGGTVQSAFTTMDNGGLYHISYGEHKVDASFTTYLPDYQVPFVFVNPTMTTHDQLTFAHEFGHFCNYYANGGGTPGVDVAEVFSQGLELLSLFYAQGGSDLEKLKLASSLSVFVEQCFLADFEDRVYRMNPADLSPENVRSLFAQVAQDYGMVDYMDARGYVSIPHLFTSPMYVISYVVSEDAAMQLYQLEKDEAGAGLARYEDNLATTQSGFLAFLQDAKLDDPFQEGHMAEVRKSFENAFRL